MKFTIIFNGCLKNKSKLNIIKPVIFNNLKPSKPMENFDTMNY